jgi:chromosome segregation ATPase
MFAKRTKQSSRKPSTDDGSQTGQSGPDPRDAAIEQLERELGEQRALATTLRESLDAATFKVEVLEKSYAKQLTEARDKRAALEIELEEKQQILAGLGGPHEHTLRELSDAVAVIKVLKAERDQLRKQIAQGSFRQANERQTNDRPTRAPLAADEASDGTINALIANAGWAEKKPSAGTGHASAQVAEQVTPHEEMLAPELVFTSKDKEKDDER